MRQLLALVESFEQLEVVRLLATDPHRPWPGEELARASSLDEDTVRASLRALVASGVVAGADPWELAEAWRAGGAELRRSYDENPLPVLRVMSDNAVSRLRTAAVRTFADAFVVRRKDDGS